MAKRVIYQLIMPSVIILVSAVLTWKWPDITGTLNKIRELQSIFVILPLLPFAVFFIGFTIGWRYNYTGMIFVSIVMCLSYIVLNWHNDINNELLPMHNALVILLPLNMCIFSLVNKRRIFSPIGLFLSTLIFLQICLFFLFYYPLGEKLSTRINEFMPTISKAFIALSSHLQSLFQCRYSILESVTFTPCTLVFSGVIFFLLLRLFKNVDAMRAGFVGAVIAVYLGIVSYHYTSSLAIYFSAAGIILIIASMEASFSLAYNDELTGLPGRRSLDETLTNLGRKYTLAMIDVDHFKKFNDTYGHDTGDQVLKLIAANLREISGNVKTFRYGGEEFTAIFPGKDAETAIPYLEKYRKKLENTPFIIRSRERRKKSKKNRNKKNMPGHKQAKITVSIGVASPDKDLNNPKKVLKAADKALYRAKKAGRNKVSRYVS
jgi:GGDEF domain-containing protein